ncbi:SGNH/GDSL hydrolase family protein [Cytobacillus firmus]|uniref:SGNH/GDSL hydrolase family protein n=1 Tax=Cytobacillus firmus TaxID=1399 RepID=UPI003676EB6C
MQITANSVKLLTGGNVIKQGDETPLTFELFDETGNLVDLQGATVAVKIANQQVLVLEKAATINSDNSISIAFTQEDVTGNGVMRLEFQVTYSDQEKEIFPADGWQEIRITPSIGNLDNGNIAVVTVEKIRQEYQQQIDDFTDDVNSRLTNVNQQAAYAQTQGDYAKAEADRLVNVDAAQFDARLTDVSEQLAHMTQQKIKLLDDVDTTFKANKPIDIDYLKSRQIILYGKFYQKLRSSDQTVTITCRGDSITQGRDTTSADRVGEIASITYPQALQSRLDSIYPDKVTVITNAMHGDNTEAGYNRFLTSSGADMTLVMYGINDAVNAGYATMGDIEAYISYYEQIIIRLILQNSAVIILTPSKEKSSFLTAIDIYRNALYVLGKKYGVPVVTTDEWTSGYKGSEIYSDDTHFNGKGYEIFGSRVASLFVGEGVSHPKKVSHGSELLTRISIDNAVLVGAVASSQNPGTPAESVDTNGIQVTIGQGQKVVYSFYAETDNLFVVPDMYQANGSTVKLSLDFGVKQPDFYFDESVHLPADINNSLNGFIDIVNNTGVGRKVTKNYGISKDIGFHIVQKGWHTLTIEAVVNGISFAGLHFVHYDIKNTLNHGRIHQELYDMWYSSPTPVIETRLPINKLEKYLGYNHAHVNVYDFRDTPFKLTVYNNKNSILEYVFVLGSDNLSSQYFALYKRTDMATPSGERTCTNIVLDPNTDEVVITWGGNTSKLSSFEITVL